VPFHGRGLTSVTVGNFTELENALEGSAATIRLTAGMYNVASTLTISRDVTLTADVEGSSVVLDGGNALRVMTINSGTVQLTGLTITNGYVRHASTCASLLVGAHFSWNRVPKANPVGRAKASTAMRSLLDLTSIAPIHSIAPLKLTSESGSCAHRAAASTSQVVTSPSLLAQSVTMKLTM
jgi:hypothetical protein